MTGGFNVDKTGKSSKTGFSKQVEQRQEMNEKLKKIEKNSIWDPNTLNVDKETKTIDLVQTLLGAGLDLGEGETGLKKTALRNQQLSTMKNMLNETYQNLAEKKISVKAQIKKIKPEYTE